MSTLNFDIYSSILQTPQLGRPRKTSK